MKKIDLSETIGAGIYTFAGRTQGEQARKSLGLDKEDEDPKTPTMLLLPARTKLFASSFYLGLLAKSYKTLKEDFNKKYIFDYSRLPEDRRKLIIKEVISANNYMKIQLSEEKRSWLKFFD